MSLTDTASRPEARPSAARLDPQASAIIDLFRLVAILMMITIHIPYDIDMAGATAAARRILAEPLSLASGDGLFLAQETIMVFLRNGLARGGHVALVIVSAWFLVDALERKGRAAAFASRLRTLGVPYLVWNVLFILVAAAVLGRGFPPAELPAAMGWGQWPANYPLHFLRDILIAAALLTLGWPLLRGRPLLLAATGCVLCAACLVLGTSWYNLGDNGLSFLPRATIVLFVFVGASLHAFRSHVFSPRWIRFLERPASFLLLAVAAFAGALFLAAYGDVGTRFTAFGGVMFVGSVAARTVCSLFLFSLTVILVRHARFAISRRFVFRVFCTHLFVVAAVLTFQDAAWRADHRLVTFAGTYLGCLALGWLVTLAIDAVDRRTSLGLARYL